jgi:ubiquinone/menaquinone biosynthesis C-methylase UbiE
MTGDAEKPDFPDQTFDLILTTESDLDPAASLWKPIREWGRVLKKGRPASEF